MDGSIVHAGERRERGSGGDDVTGTAALVLRLIGHLPEAE
jgi:hypothetical protein